MSGKYLLDSNIVIPFLRHQYGSTLWENQSVAPSKGQTDSRKRHLDRSFGNATFVDARDTRSTL